MTPKTKGRLFRLLRVRCYYLVILAFATALAYFGDFRPGPKTVEVWLEDDFTAAEEAGVVAAVDEWNRVIGPLAGRDVLVYRGRVSYPDGYHPDDADDGIHIIYRRSGNWNFSAPGDSVLGATMEGEDIEIYADRIGFSPELFEVVVLHELGHLLVSGDHGSRPGTIMFSEILTYTPQLTPYDQAYYCQHVKCR